ncbi:FxLYD domain-containing protein [Halobacillus mangrovi]|uniref:FxLYD domain-containing protein n=1 Tax=Halobacillus mangrovi TaxID=402384 RepID=UPI003D9512E9
MRKIILLFSLVFIMFLTACSNGEMAGDTNASANNDETTKEKEETKEESEAKLEIAQSTGGAWKDSIDAVWVHSSAVFENTGDTPVEINETQMTFKGKDGEVLGTAPMIYAVPSVVGPGETAFISESTILEGISDAESYTETTYNFGFDKTDQSPNLLETSGIKGTIGDEYSNPYKVTGLVKNTTEEKQDDIRLAAALFDKDGKLLGVLNGSVDVGVNPGSEAGFELNYPEIPRDVAEKVENIEVKAYGWTW